MAHEVVGRSAEGGCWVDRLVDRRLSERSEDIAVIDDAGRLTNGELRARILHLAARLRAIDVGVTDPVGVFVEHSLELPVAVLGVLASGGCCVPLDPSLPPGRIRAILDETTPRVLVTQRHLSAAATVPGATVVELDALAPIPDGMPPTIDIRPRTSEDIAFVLFTSGSTGRAKGVVLSHGAITHRLTQVVAETSLSAGERDLLWTPLSFVVFVDELLFPMLAGISTVIANPRLRLDTGALSDLVTKHRVTMFRTTPSLLRTMLADHRFARCKSLRRIVCSGEVLPGDVQQRFFEILDAELYTAYGCTEAPGAMILKCSPGPAETRTTVGRPAAAAKIEILREDHLPTACNEVGEIALGGPGLAHGYWRRPDLTAQRFITMEHPNGVFDRKFLTGDRGRRRDDGTYEVLGRIEGREVKVRGVRVDLGEVEASISACAGVDQAVVSVDGTGVDGQRIVAFWVACATPHPSQDDLRDSLRANLPDAAIPSRFVRLDRLPLTANGKIDSAAVLGSSPLGRRDLNHEPVLPRTPVEEALVEIWATVLGVDSIGIHDSFFHLGGDSIHAAQILSRVRNRFRVGVPFSVLFEEPTVAELAREIVRDR